MRYFQAACGNIILSFIQEPILISQNNFNLDFQLLLFLIILEEMYNKQNYRCRHSPTVLFIHFQTLHKYMEISLSKNGNKSLGENL